MALTGRAVWDTYLANNLLAGDGIVLTPDTNLRQTTVAVRVASGGGLAFADGELTADIEAIGVVAPDPDTIAKRWSDGSLAMTIAVLGEYEAPDLGCLGRDADGRLSVHVDGGPKVVPVAGDYMPAPRLVGDLLNADVDAAHGDVCIMSSLVGGGVNLPPGGSQPMVVFVVDIEASGTYIQINTTDSSSIGFASSPYIMTTGGTNNVRMFLYVPIVANWFVFSGI